MNYLRTYIRLIRKAQTQCEIHLYEKHHIFPVSIFGKNNYIVKLTPRQHYVAHALLYKAFKKRYGNNHPKTFKMMCAFNAMHSKSQAYKYVNSRLYEYLRKAYSESMKGKNNPFYGKTHTKETKQKMRKPKPGVRGENHYLFGKSMPDETKKKISQTKSGQKRAYLISDLHRKRLSAAKTGENHPMFGKRGADNPRYGTFHTEESKRKMSESSTGKTHSAETKQKISQQFKGRKWWTNGVNDTLSKECPKGFYRGRSATRKNK